MQFLDFKEECETKRTGELDCCDWIEERTQSNKLIEYDN